MNAGPGSELAAMQRALSARDWPRLAQLAASRQALAPEDAEGHFLGGIAALEQGRVAVAIPALLRAVELAPQRIDCLTQAARALAMVQRLPEALTLAERALGLEPADALALDTLGVVFSRGNAHARAAEAFRRAVALDPRRAAFHFNLAAALKFLGDFDAAEAAYEACIAGDPHYWKAHSALAQLRRQTPEANHIARLESLLPSAQGHPEAWLHLHHALAKEHEDLGDYAQAFACLERGKRPRRAALGYRFEDDAAMFEALVAAFPEPLPAPVEGLDGEAIFVVGMPRSGTTLVERILSSHPQVHSAGELQNFGALLKRSAATPGPRLLDPATIAAMSAAATQGRDLAELGRRYLASTRPGTGHTPRFVDKMPLNVLYAGWIARALPRSPIICLRRDPLDTCLSNFRQLFAVNFSYYNYAYDLLDTGRYFLAFERLVAHWRQTLPGRILEVRYEELLVDQEAQTRRLLDFCALPFDPVCLRFEDNPSPVATASAVQVRQPIYHNAAGRWRHYAAQLEPLRELLEGGGAQSARSSRP